MQNYFIVHRNAIRFSIISIECKSIYYEKILREYSKGDCPSGFTDKYIDAVMRMKGIRAVMIGNPHHLLTSIKKLGLQIVKNNGKYLIEKEKGGV